METAPTIADFNPPLKAGDRFRSVMTPAHYGYQVVEKIEALGVIAAHYLADGARGGHVQLFEFTYPGNRAGGINRL